MRLKKAAKLFGEKDFLFIDSTINRNENEKEEDLLFINKNKTRKWEKEGELERELSNNYSNPCIE